MAEPNPYTPPNAPVAPSRPAPTTSSWPCWGAIFGAFLGVGFAGLCHLSETLFLERASWGTIQLNPLGRTIAIGLTIVGAIIGGLVGQVLARQAAVRALRNKPTA